VKIFVNVTLAALVALGTVITACADTVNIYTDWDAQNAHWSQQTLWEINGYWFQNEAGTPLYLAGGAIDANSFYYWGSNPHIAEVSSLAATPYTTVQQAQLQSLYDHVYYSKAYNEDNFVAGQFIQNDRYAQLLAIAVEAILFSSTPDDPLTLYTNTTYEGDVYYAYETSRDWDYLQSVWDADDAALLTQWFSAINDNAWDLLDGYDEINVELTSYRVSRPEPILMAMAISYASNNNDDNNNNNNNNNNNEQDYIQLFGVSRVTDFSPTPEPATMLIVGLGLAGLGLASRRRKNK
jgi:hypothetical protein